MAKEGTQHATMRDSVYQALKDAIVSGNLTWGEQLKEAQLAAKYHVSRSPVREALHLLSSDGLVVNYPHRGVFVRSITKEEIDDLTHFRMLLENRGIALSNTNMTPEIREELLEIKQTLTRSLEENDFELHAATDARLHRLTITLCRNKLIEQCYDQMDLLVRMLNVWAIKNPERFKISYAEHMIFIHHLLCGDSHEAVMANTSHLSRNKDELYRIVDELESQGRINR